ncbi:MAG: TetR/AcrR family transcriptional regulator [Desulfohalobiaceae bacterium]
MNSKSTFMQLKQRERALRRDLILDAALQLFAQRPFHEIGMRDIADEAGISPASIYRYFSSRDDILAEILGYAVEEGRQRQQERLQNSATDFEDVAQGIVDFFLEKESTLQMLSHFLLREEVDEEAREKFKAVRQHYLGEFDQILVRMGYEGGNVRLFSNAFFASMLGIALSFRNQDQNPEETKKHIRRLARLSAIVFKNGIPGPEL